MLHRPRRERPRRKDRDGPIEPLVIEPIAFAHPDPENQEHQLIVHESASTEAPEAQEVPVVDPITTKDNGPQDNVFDDEVLPQIEHHMVSSPVLTSNDLTSIGRPLTLIA